MYVALRPGRQQSHDRRLSVPRSHWWCYVALLCILGPTRLRAQEQAVRRISVGVLAGTWSIGEGRWPYVMVGGAYDVSAGVSLGLQVGGVSRPVELCSAGYDAPMCDKRKLIRIVTANVRLELGSAAVRPYLAASMGPTWYYHDGTLAAVHAGVAIPVKARTSFRLDSALQFFSEGGEGGAATSLQGGAYIRL